VQHIADPVLKRMHRRGSSVEISALIDRIRSLMPDAVIRTTLIVGFPGESEADFRLLEEFVRLTRFNRLGVFAYSPEEDTLAKDYPDQIDEETKSSRKERIMLLQRRISQENHRRQKNRVHTTLIEHYDPESEYYYGRSYAFAPDDVDGYIVFQSHKQHAIGDIVNVRITDTNAYDLLGNVQDEVEP
jgi:ribosomal protein S12 methylthiotransferase